MLFIPGVYAIAVHAKWLQDNGKADFDDRTPEALSLLKHASFQKNLKSLNSIHISMNSKCS
jgi:hypothetical protein